MHEINRRFIEGRNREKKKITKAYAGRCPMVSILTDFDSSKSLLSSTANDILVNLVHGRLVKSVSL